MERCEWLPLSWMCMKKCLCKNKTVQQTVIRINQLFKVHTLTHTHMSSALAATDQWPCRWHSAWTQPRQKLTAATDCRRSSTLQTNFYPNRTTSAKHFLSTSTIARVILIFITPFTCKKRSSITLLATDCSCWLFMEKPLSTWLVRVTTVMPSQLQAIPLDNGLLCQPVNTKVFQFTLCGCVNEISKLLHDDITISFADNISFNTSWQKVFHHGSTLFSSRSYVARIRFPTFPWLFSKNIFAWPPKVPAFFQFSLPVWTLIILPYN